MGRLYDSLKQRGEGLPAASSMASTAPRLQVIPATADLPVADDHAEMPSYEVPVQEAKPSPQPAIFSEARTQPAKENKNETRRMPSTPPTSKVIFTPQEMQRLPSHSISSRIVVVHQPDSADAKDYGKIADHLSRLLMLQQARSLTLLPIEPIGTAPTLTANLACAWAETTKHPIILIDAARSSRAEGLAALLGLGVAPGWEELMMGADLAQAIQQTGWAWLDAIAGGNRLAPAGTAAWAKKAASILHTLGKHYQSIILLGPAHSPLGIVLAETTDATCLLVTADQAQEQHSTLHSLANHPARVVGTIVMDK